jgi:peptidoglycan/xylan/chitin deacetylase (PgdA/CDA1 family)
MAGKREHAARALARGGLVQALGSLHSACVRDLRVLAYHRVLPALNEDSYPGDVELVSALQADFDWQMAYLARRFHPVSCRQVADALDGGTPLPRRAVMVTFDDGFRDNFEVAWPTLRQHGVPAVFFLSTGYIDSQVPFWFDRLVQVLLLMPTGRLQIDALGQVLDLAPSTAGRRPQAALLLRAIKRVPDATRCAVLQQLEQQLEQHRHTAGLPAAPLADPLAAPMCWQQVRQMSQAGMEFGSHTVTHPVLARLANTDQLRSELVQSRQRIEHETGQPVVALAYPVGGRDAFDAQVLAATAEAGYRLAFSYQPGANRPAPAQRLQLKRLHVERDTTRAMFAAVLELPGVFGR